MVSTWRGGTVLVLRQIRLDARDHRSNRSTRTAPNRPVRLSGIARSDVSDCSKTIFELIVDRQTDPAHMNV